MTKRKERIDGETAFITHLPIEECAYRLDLLNSEDLHIELVKMTSDTVNFTATMYRHDRIRAVGKGALRRWEGTLTRVDVQVKVHEGLLTWALLITLLLCVSLLLVPLMVLTAALVNPVAWLFVSGLAIGAILGLMWMANNFAPHDDVPRDLLRMLEEALQ